MNQKNSLENPIGYHTILDLYNCSNTEQECDEIKSIFLNGLLEGNFTVLSNHFHQFEPHGLSGIFILAESHLSLHIWEELKYVSLDIYWCGKTCDEQKLINKIIPFFNPKNVEYKHLHRGFF